MPREQVIRVIVPSQSRVHFTVQLKFSKQFKLPESRRDLAFKDATRRLSVTTRIDVPGKILVKQYDRGGPGVGYFQPWLHTFEEDGSLPNQVFSEGEWLSYTVNPVHGGYYKLFCNVTPLSNDWSAEFLLNNRVIAHVGKGAHGVQTVYLSSKSDRLILLTLRGRACWTSFSFSTTSSIGKSVPASFGNYQGVIDIYGSNHIGGGQYISGLGRIGASAVWTVYCDHIGDSHVIFDYRNTTSKPIGMRIKVGLDASSYILFPPTKGGHWAKLIYRTSVKTHWVDVELIGTNNNYSSIDLRSVSGS